MGCSPGEGEGIAQDEALKMKSVETQCWTHAQA